MPIVNLTSIINNSRRYNEHNERNCKFSAMRGVVEAIPKKNGREKRGKTSSKSLRFWNRYDLCLCCVVLQPF